MTRLGLFLAIPFLTSQLCSAQQPAKNSEAFQIGLRGSVHTVLTESFDNREHPEVSTLTVYDRDGYELEEYRYEPDRSLHSHTKYTRKGWQVFKTETTSSVPAENRTFVQSFNSQGLVTGTETYDGNGALISRTRNDFGQRSGGATLSTSQDVKPDGTVSSVETVDESRPVGLSRQSATKDGKPYYDSLVQRDANGNPTADALRFADGSFNEREVKPDGTTVEHKYWAPTKTHTYQTTDANNRVLEVIEESAAYYTRTTFRYDGAGRQTEIANYDRSGKLLHKGSTEYQEDGNGNWIEQREYNWDATMRNKPPKLGSVNRRTITYY
jgi:YD repeat-containing protein